MRYCCLCLFACLKGGKNRRFLVAAAEEVPAASGSQGAPGARRRLAPHRGQNSKDWDDSAPQDVHIPSSPWVEVEVTHIDTEATEWKDKDRIDRGRTRETLMKHSPFGLHTKLTRAADRWQICECVAELRTDFESREWSKRTSEQGQDRQTQGQVREGCAVHIFVVDTGR